MARCEVRLRKTGELIGTTTTDRVPQIQDTFEIDGTYYTVLEQSQEDDSDVIVIHVRKAADYG